MAQTYYERRSAGDAYLRYVEFDVLREVAPRTAPTYRARCLLGDCVWSGYAHATPGMAIEERDRHAIKSH